MIIVKIERHDTEKGTVETLGLMSLLRRNNKDDPDRPDFEVRVARGERFTNPRATVAEVFGDPETEVRIEKFPRSAVSVWRLLREALNKTHPGDLP